MLELQDVYLSFNSGTINEKIVFQGLNFTVKDGEFITILGGNGSGKSSLMNIISGVYIPNSGKVILDGDDISKDKEHKRARNVGRLFQDPMRGTAPNMTIAENLGLAYLRGKKRNISRGIKKDDISFFKEVLSELKLGLEDRMDTKVKFLSGGQRQALTLIMATIVTPKLLLLDEHTAALDPVTASKVMEVTDSIVKRDKITTMMITHNMEQAIKYGNRLIMLSEGKIVYDVKSEEKKDIEIGELFLKYNI